MSASDQPDRDEDRLLAGEYALGLLPPDEAVAFEDRLSSDPELRALYASWAEDFASLTDGIAPVAPPRQVANRESRHSCFRKRGSPSGSAWGFTGWAAWWPRSCSMS